MGNGRAAAAIFAGIFMGQRIGLQACVYYAALECIIGAQFGARALSEEGV